MPNRIQDSVVTQNMNSIPSHPKVTATHAPPARPKRPSKGRVFQCTGYPDCNMSFTRSEHLARHLRKHTGERPFTCPHCSKSFSRLDNLRQHKQTVHAYEALPMHGHKDDYQDIHQPETPYHSSTSSYGGTPLQPVLISPADSASPNSRYQDGRPQQYVQYDQGLKIPSHQFKPKRRPRPLSLLHSFIDQSNSSPDTMNLLRPPLHSAPPIPFNKHRTVVTYPSSSNLIPSMVSPLSPLFHQSFSQVGSRGTSTLPPITSQNNVSHLTSPYASSTFRFTQSSLKLPATLPSVKQLCLSNRNMNNSNDTTGPTGTVSPATSKESSKEFKDENRKSWLQGVLNDETNQPSIKDAPAAERHNSASDTKKATITSLLSP